MGFYPPDALVQEARRRAIAIAPPDANRSRVLCHVEVVPGGRGGGRGGARSTGWCGSGSATSRGCRGRRWRRSSRSAERGGAYRGVADLASRSGVGVAGLERLAWAGALDGIPADRRRHRGRRRAPRGALAGRRQRQRPRRRQAHPAGAADRAARGAAAAAARGLGRADRRLRLDRDRLRPAPDGADATRPRPGAAAQRRAGAERRRRHGRGRRHGRRPPAPRHRQGDRLHDPGRRGRDRQRDRPQARL